MSHVVVTGSRGFLGWHLRSALMVDGIDSRGIPLGNQFDEISAAESLGGASRALHLAGINRGTDSDVVSGNILMAKQFASALLRTDVPPASVVYANSTQAGSDTPYGRAKQEAASIIGEAAQSLGAAFVDVKLPNLFGEHGRPFYNSVVATFCHLVATGGSPAIDVDRELTLLHAQDAADLLLGRIEDPGPYEVRHTVRGVLDSIRDVAASYSGGAYPSRLLRRGEMDLLNTFRSYLPFEPRAFPPIPPASRIVVATGEDRAFGGRRRGFERLSVEDGAARVSLVRLLTHEMVELEMSAQEALTLDIPSMWTASVRNIGAGQLSVVQSLIEPDDRNAFITHD